MVIPFEPGAVERSDAADGELADICREGRLGADRAEERVPPVRDGEGVQKRAIEWEQAARAAAGLDSREDLRFLWGAGWRGVGDIWETHFEYAVVSAKCSTRVFEKEVVISVNERRNPLWTCKPAGISYGTL